MPTAVEYGLLTGWHSSTAIEYGLTNSNHAGIGFGGPTQIHDGNPWHDGDFLAHDGYTWSSGWHSEVTVAPPAPASADWQLVGVFAAALLVMAAIALAVRRRLASR